MTDFEDPQDDDLAPSKSALKREMQELQELGETLIKLPASHFDRMPLSEDMREAMALYKRLKHNEAKRRQMQYIGKHMHREAVAEIRAVFEEIDNEAKRFRQHSHQLEQKRDELIQGDNDVLTAFFDAHPDIDRQELRNLVRQAKKELSQKKSPAASRKLFRFLRENLTL
jgi:ribosome-associated protein